MHDKLQRGQALILIALAFVGLAAFIGLAVDAGILYTNIGHLRRAVDAAALAAANQFREGLTVAQLESSAKEFLDFNNLSSASAQVFVCEESIVPGGPYSAYHDPTLCRCLDDDGDPDTPLPEFGDPTCTDSSDLDHRKLVRVRGVLPVTFAFLPIIGFDSVDVNAEAISETAALDLILAIDTSASMAYDLCSDGDDNDADGVTDDCNINDPPNQFGAIPENDVPRCVTDGDCQPFEDVRDAAQFLINRMYFPFDRMAIVNFSQFGNMPLDLAGGDDWAVVTNALNALDVNPEPDPATWCPDWFSTQDPSGCTSTNTAAGIRLANNELGGNGRQEAVWILILLSDGAANAAQDDSSPPEWVCPGSTGAPTWVQPFCRDTDPASRHAPGDSDYDADDRARDMADLAGCLPTNFAPCTAPGNGVVIFTVGLGGLVNDNDGCDTSVYSVAECNDA
ncbi:MAG TPA: vWA domain-containing protein, partial [Anaerolineales bacterium]